MQMKSPQNGTLHLHASGRIPKTLQLLADIYTPQGRTLRLWTASLGALTTQGPSYSFTYILFLPLFLYFFRLLARLHLPLNYDESREAIDSPPSSCD